MTDSSSQGKHPSRPKKGDRFKLNETGELWQCIEDSKIDRLLNFRTTRAVSLTNKSKHSVSYAFGKGSMWTYIGNFDNYNI